MTISTQDNSAAGNGGLGDTPTGLPRSAKGSGRRLRGAVAHYLGSAIVSGRIAPGERLTGEIENAEALDVSRSAYREAIQVLTAKGLVESRPKAGTRVLPRSHWNLLDPMVLAWAFGGEPDVNYVRDLFELRAIVEPEAARLAAKRRDRNDVAAMKDALTRMRRFTLATEQGREADRDFHSALLACTGNAVLMTLSASIGAAVNWTTQFKQRSVGLPRDPVPDHMRVYDAIAAGDADAAAEAMQVLVQLALDDTRAAMQRPADGEPGDLA
ncbi:MULTISPECIES: FadR/GntR family transcriptional regulator [Sphingobium]|uniref:FadR/GntR family transcriptional regulator n=1 Tax=Sphingobium TaxID=165695 RepID=UPI0015EBD4A4|nr:MULTISPECIES: FadR/GntR family transcriptional regulator [Sphingobium]MCW2362297.1 DNA-binding FadR family transcriptional regulator [Sphingobium sp. B10D3B]MCW2401024.1 DNA-binding FadR family transcriptional regulator [Sphingobium sp. B10D7B]MCW2408003.1 DNA-binding FadR family transcriptional regulator [Sphingobium xanthum]